MGAAATVIASQTCSCSLMPSKHHLQDHKRIPANSGTHPLEPEVPEVLDESYSAWLQVKREHLERVWLQVKAAG